MEEEQRMNPAAIRYNRRYFDKWYRDPVHRVSTAAVTTRKAAVAVTVAEYFMERPVRTVLDVGCGEGQWRAALRRLRPDLHYTGVDPSRYAVGRFGRSRNLLLGGLGDLPGLDLLPKYDLIVCSDVLYYVPRAELVRGFSGLVDRLGGVAFLEAYGSDEVAKGDTRTIERRDPGFYRRLFRRHGLMSCGPHCYVGEVLRGGVLTLERGGV